MYKPHPAFKVPEDDNTKIWRYIDFTKFVSLLDQKALFFPRVSYLEDKYEGLYPRMFTDENAEMYSSIPPEYREQVLKAFLNKSKQIRNFMLVSCWHINDHESAAMWKMYLKSNEGIAIQSTFGRLKESFKDYKDQDVHIGKVQYIDYERESISTDNILQAYMHKRKSFEYENELRVLVTEFNDWKQAEPSDTGRFIPVDLEGMIENIYVCPQAPPWFSDLIRSVVKKYNLDKNVLASDDNPLY
jgi:hypothetical protein